MSTGPPGGTWAHARAPSVTVQTRSTAVNEATGQALGFSFTGPVTVYAAFQACGVVHDHLRDCVRRGAYRGPVAEISPGRQAASREIRRAEASRLVNLRVCHTVCGQYGRCHDQGP